MKNGKIDEINFKGNKRSSMAKPVIQLRIRISHDQQNNASNA